MPRYQFRVYSRASTTEPVSRTLDNTLAAQNEAAKTIGAIISDAGAAVWRDGSWGVTVGDEDGRTLFSLFIAATNSATGRINQMHAASDKER